MLLLTGFDYSSTSSLPCMHDQSTNMKGLLKHKRFLMSCFGILRRTSLSTGSSDAIKQIIALGWKFFLLAGTYQSVSYTKQVIIL